MNTAIITMEEAEKARLRAHYGRLKASKPDAAHKLLKEHIKRVLEATTIRGPVQILP